MGWTSTDLLSAIKRRASIPNVGGDYTNAALLAMADEESDAQIVSKLIKASGEYLVYSHDYSIVSGQAAYRIAPRAVGTKLRDAVLVDSDGHESSLAQIELEHKSDASYRLTAAAYGGGGLMFWMQGNTINLEPPPTSAHASYTLRTPYYRRPNRLVETSACALVSSVSGADVTVTGTIPSTMTSGVKCDIISGKPGFEWLDTNIEIQSVSSPTITFTKSVSTDVAAGDYVCLAEETPIPQLPPELHRLLAQYVALQVMENKGDLQGVKIARARLAEMVRESAALLSPRVEGEPQVIVNRYGPVPAARGILSGGWHA